MKIYTKTGDDGTTGLFGGPRVQKCDLRIHAFGNVDELNSVLGVAASGHGQFDDADARHAKLGLDLVIAAIQHDLFGIGAELATPNPDTKNQRWITEKNIERLESWIDEYDQQLPPLTNFILPGGSPPAAALHWARTICRRAERDVVHLSQQPGVSELKLVIIYLNRLSDLLFVLARIANLRLEIPDVAWSKEKFDSASACMQQADATEKNRDAC